MRRARLKSHYTLVVCLVAAVILSGQWSTAGKREAKSRFGISVVKVKDELRFRLALDAAKSNPVLAKYIGDLSGLMHTKLENLSVCAIVDSLNADYMLATGMGIDVSEMDEPKPTDLATRVCAIITPAGAEYSENDGKWIVHTEIHEESGQRALETICGTGFLYLEEDIVATAAHVVDYSLEGSYRFVFDFMLKAGESEVDTFYSDDQVRSGSVLALNVICDWALLKLDESMNRDPLEPSDFEPPNQLVLDKNVFALGHPHGLPLKFTGVNAVTCLGYADCPAYFKTSLPLLPHNSGSPVFFADGPRPLVGLHTSTSGDTVEIYGEECILVEGWDGCDDSDDKDCAVWCGANETRIDIVRLEEEEEEANVAWFVNDANTDAFLFLGNKFKFKPIFQLEPHNDVQIPWYKTSAVWLLSCGDQEGDPRCRWLRYPIRPGDRWRIKDEVSKQFDIPPGTRVIMERG